MTQVTQVTNEQAIERAKQWAESEPLGTVYYYEEWDDPEDDTTAYTNAYTLPKSDEDPDSSITIHRVSVVSCEVEERDSESILCKVEAIAFQTDDDSEEEYEHDVTYWLRIWDGCIELEAVD